MYVYSVCVFVCVLLKTILISLANIKKLTNKNLLQIMHINQCFGT